MKTYIVFLYSDKDLRGVEFTTRGKDVEQAIQEALEYYKLGNYKVASVFKRVYTKGENE